jgi:hypothetical protein
MARAPGRRARAGTRIPRPSGHDIYAERARSRRDGPPVIRASRSEWGQAHAMTTPASTEVAVTEGRTARLPDRLMPCTAARSRIAAPRPTISSARQRATSRKSTMPVTGKWSARTPLTAGPTSRRSSSARSVTLGSRSHGPGRESRHAGQGRARPSRPRPCRNAL